MDLLSQATTVETGITLQLHHKISPILHRMGFFFVVHSRRRQIHQMAQDPQAHPSFHACYRPSPETEKVYTLVRVVDFARKVPKLRNLRRSTPGWNFFTTSQLVPFKLLIIFLLFWNHFAIDFVYIIERDVNRTDHPRSIINFYRFWN